LSRLQAAPSVDASPLGMVKEKILFAEPPFDGMCQICLNLKSDFVLPVRLDFVPKEDMKSFDSEAKFQSCVLPCYLCHACDKILARSMWIGFAQQVLDVFLHSFWLMVAFIVAWIVAAFLPLIGIGFVVAVVWRLYQQLTRKKGNPALMNHLDGICSLEHILKEAYTFKLRPLKRVQPEKGKTRMHV
jgi:hypothetical protein